METCDWCNKEFIKLVTYGDMKVCEDCLDSVEGDEEEEEDNGTSTATEAKS